MGVANIKTDFGEDVHFDANYQMPAAGLHNNYALLYQRAAYEVTEQITGVGLIWARASWAGTQRYPVHWGRRWCLPPGMDWLVLYAAACTWGCLVLPFGAMMCLVSMVCQTL